MRLGLTILTGLLSTFYSSAQVDDDIKVSIECDSTAYSSCRNVTISGQLVNQGSHIKHVFPDLLESSVLALTVYNEKGERIPTIPPSVPKNDPFVKIEPKETVKLSYHLNIFSPELPPGNYFIKMNQFSSNQLMFKIE